MQTPLTPGFSKLLLAMLCALQFLSLNPVQAQNLEQKQPLAGVNNAQEAIHFIANKDPRCPRHVVPEPAYSLSKGWVAPMRLPQVLQHATPAHATPPVAVAPAPAAPAPALGAGLVHSQEARAEKKPMPTGAQPSATERMRLYAPAPAPTMAMAHDAARQHVSARKYEPNPVKRTVTDPISTFSVDVDTGSYASVRGLLRKGQSLPAGTVRVEEMLNYFDYAYPRPEQTQSPAPFALTTEIAPSPWNERNHLLRVGVQARDAAKDSLPPANLVFLLDVSGSMHIPDGLPLVQDAMLGLVQQLRAQDRVTLVTYAGSTRVVLPPTSGAHKERLAQAICGLQAGGSTAGASGIRLAYEQAKAAFIPGGINRILLATDGDFNVGVSNTNQLKDMVAAERKYGISLSTLGVGGVSYNDHLMEQIADAGDGKYSFMDNLREARKVLVHEFTSTLQTVAQDVKLQLEFNPAVVKEYRLIGYENRQLAREDFANDAVDAGDIGAGHRVTALYEVTLAGQDGLLGQERYSANRPVANTGGSADELGFLKIRYKTPSDNPTVAQSQEISHAIGAKSIKTPAQASADFKFAAAVAAAGQIWGQGKHVGVYTLAQAQALAQAGIGADAFGLRREFVELLGQAQSAGSNGSLPPVAQ